MGRPRKIINSTTIDDFVQYYEMKRHDWIADTKMNGYVNAALGLDIFSIAAWPFSCAISEEEVLICYIGKSSYKVAAKEFDYSAAVKFMEGMLHDSECR